MSNSNRISYSKNTPWVDTLALSNILFHQEKKTLREDNCQLTQKSVTLVSTLYISNSFIICPVFTLAEFIH